MSTDETLVNGSCIFKIFLRADDTHFGRTLHLQGLSLLWCTTLVWPFLISWMVKLISDCFAVI